MFYRPLFYLYYNHTKWIIILTTTLPQPLWTYPYYYRHHLKEKDEEILAKEQARHAMLAPLRGQQLKNYVTDIRNQLNSERLAEKKAAYNEAVTKYVPYHLYYIILLYYHYIVGLDYSIILYEILEYMYIYCRWMYVIMHVNCDYLCGTGRRNRRRSSMRRDSKRWQATKTSALLLYKVYTISTVVLTVHIHYCMIL